MSILLGMIAVFAILSLVVAVRQAVKIVRLAPASAALGPFMVLGWWKFATLEARVGLATAADMAIYKRAAVAFLILIVLGMMPSGWAANQSVPRASAEGASITDPGNTPTAFTFNTDLRRVAMPGVPL
ncbi:MAG: hypothetical protein MO852_02125 [Candidatus Devosia euplotis]|nr:hypothetical protein [Candidatus Devosia euplotis]